MNHFKFFDQKLWYVNKVDWAELTKAILTIYNDTDRAHYSRHKNETDIFMDKWLTRTNKKEILIDLKKEKDGL